LAHRRDLLHPWLVQRLVRVFEDFVYGFDSGVDVPMEAAHALVRGIDAPALVELAGLNRQERLEIRDLIPAAAEQLGFQIEPLKAVFERRVRAIAAAYLAGEREFTEALSAILALFWRYQDEGIGYCCCDALLDLELWLEVREYARAFGSEEAAERDFRARAIAMVDGCRSCTVARHQRVEAADRLRLPSAAYPSTSPTATASFRGHDLSGAHLAHDIDVAFG
jgi:hypothetical protein